MRIVEPVHAADEAVVDMLEAILDSAKAGELRMVAVAGVRTSGETCNGYAGLHHPATLIGELSIVQREVMDEYIDMKRKPAGEGYVE